MLRLLEASTSVSQTFSIPNLFLDPPRLSQLTCIWSSASTIVSALRPTCLRRRFIVAKQGGIVLLVNYCLMFLPHTNAAELGNGQCFESRLSVVTFNGLSLLLLNYY